MRAHHLKNQEIDTLVAPDVAIQGTLVTRAEETESPYIFQTLILNKGSQDGVRIGDVFAVYHSKESEISTEVAVVGYTSNVQKNSSSMTIIKMSDNKISSGDRALLVRRTVFKGGGEN
jgi:cell shape-determining protein MreC